MHLGCWWPVRGPYRVNKAQRAVSLSIRVALQSDCGTGSLGLGRVVGDSHALMCGAGVSLDARREAFVSATGLQMLDAGRRRRVCYSRSWMRSGIPSVCG